MGTTNCTTERIQKRSIVSSNKVQLVFLLILFCSNCKPEIVRFLFRRTGHNNFRFANCTKHIKQQRFYCQNLAQLKKLWAVLYNSIISLTSSNKKQNKLWKHMGINTDYGRPVRKLPSLHGRKSNPNPKFLGTTAAYFVCRIGPKFQISLIYAWVSVVRGYKNSNAISIWLWS